MTSTVPKDQPTAELPFTKEELDELLLNIDSYDAQEQEELLVLLEEYEKRVTQQACRDDLLAFCQAMQPTYIIGAHHRHLSSLLMQLERGEKDRATVSIGPRHGKSQMTSIYYPAWYLGRNPTKQVMLVSHTTDLAVDFGRKVRNIISTPEYQAIFPNVSLAVDSKSAGRWNTNHKGVFYATGVGSSLAGRGADLLVVDDPHSEQDLLAGNFAALETAYKWFTFGARTRLMPRGAVAIVACMTGDTPVLMSDGTEKELRSVTIGDVVMSYNGAAIVPKKVLNWINHGSDHIYTIRLNNGNLIRANARHPFLVVRDGVETWVRVSGLQVGESLVSLKGVQDLRDPEAQVESARPAYQGRATIGSTQTPPTENPGIGVSGLEKSAALRGVTNRQGPGGCANTTTASSTGRTERGGSQPTNSEARDLNTDMEYRLKNTTGCWPSKPENALYAGSPQAKQTPQKHGMGDSPSTTATTPNAFEPYCATFATSWSEAGLTRRGYSEGSSTYELTRVQILSIEPCGEEDVFDIEVEDTENFIANGVVSHNTRWHKSDLIGRLVKDMGMNAESDQYEVVEFPAILNENEEDEKALWPEFFDLEALKRTRASMPAYQWNAQYQQNPTGDASAICKREWWQKWEGEEPPDCEYIIQCTDAAAELNNKSDFTSITTWGIFWNDKTSLNNIILLNSVRERLEFPELKEKVLDEYTYWQPDSALVEKKSSGTPLYQELRRMGIPVGEYTPHRGTINNPNNKYARLNSVIDMIREGLVWVPDTRWAEQLVEELAEFPYGDHDDCVDTTIMALTRFRKGGFAQLATDYKDEPRMFRNRSGYY